MCNGYNSQWRSSANSFLSLLKSLQVWVATEKYERPSAFQCTSYYIQKLNRKLVSSAFCSTLGLTFWILKVHRFSFWLPEDPRSSSSSKWITQMAWNDLHLCLFNLFACYTPKPLISAYRWKQIFKLHGELEFKLSVWKLELENNWSEFSCTIYRRLTWNLKLSFEPRGPETWTVKAWANSQCPLGRAQGSCPI